MPQTKEKLKATRKIQRHRQVTIPKAMFEKLGLAPGDFVEILKQGKKLVLVPKKLIDKDQAWFWTKKWQKKEQEAEEDLKQSRTYGPFESVKKLKQHFESKQE